MPEKILLVDDEEVIRDLFAEYLGEEGISVKAVSSGEDALEEAKKEKFDLFLIDLIMPDMDGLELVRKFRELNIGARVALLTAYGDALHESERKLLNILDIIPKGISMAKVSERIKNILGEKMEKKIKILAVDDEKDVLDFLKEVVENQGYSFLAAVNGEEALNNIKEEKPNLVLLDIEMPGIDGIEVLRKIREENSELPVVILTAYSTGERMREAMGLNVSGFIPKGASVREAASKIKAVLDISVK